MKLVVIIPAYNEEKTIKEVVKGIPRTIYGIDELEILVVDDGSKDNTALYASQEGAKVFSHKRNKGLGQTFRDGIDEALRMGADIIVNIDADNQFDANDIPKLIEPIFDERADMVSGTRFKSPESISQIPFAKKWGNKAFTGLICLLTRRNFTDTQCGFRAYSREAALKLNLFGRFTYTQEVFLDLISKDLDVEEVSIRVRYYKERKAKITKSLISYFLRAIVIVLRSFRDFKPLLFFGIPGVFIFGSGFILSLYSLVYWMITKETTPVRMYAFIGIGALIFGFLLIILALIADMLKRLRRNQEDILYKLKKQELPTKND